MMSGDQLQLCAHGINHHEERHVCDGCCKAEATQILSEWKAADASQRDRIVAVRKRMFKLTGNDREAVVAWFQTPIKALEGYSPIGAIIVGKLSAVESLVDEYDSQLSL